MRISTGSFGEEEAMEFRVCFFIIWSSLARGVWMRFEWFLWASRVVVALKCCGATDFIEM